MPGETDRRRRHQRAPRYGGDGADDAAQQEHRAPSEALHGRGHQQRRQGGTKCRGRDIERRGSDPLVGGHVGHHRHRRDREERGLRHAKQHAGEPQRGDRGAGGLRHQTRGQRRHTAAEQGQHQCRAGAEALAEHAGRHLEDGVGELEAPRRDRAHRGHGQAERRHHALLRHGHVGTHQIADARHEAQKGDDPPGVGHQRPGTGEVMVTAEAAPSQNSFASPSAC